MALKTSDVKVSLRRLCLDGKGQLNRDARRVAVILRKFCKADGRAALVYSPVTGSIDTTATACQAARREVYDLLKRLLQLDEYTDVNLRDDE